MGTVGSSRKGSSRRGSGDSAGITSGLSKGEGAQVKEVTVVRAVWEREEPWQLLRDGGGSTREGESVGLPVKGALQSPQEGVLKQGS